MARYLCTVCGFIFDEEIGDIDSGIEPGTKWENVPNDWKCPLCGITKADESLWTKLE
jgi:rubredoxin-NAD+ reductase